MAGAMVLALCYFIVDAYLRFLQYEQKSLSALSLLIEFARTKPRGLSDYAVFTIMLYNKYIYPASGASSETYFKVWRLIFWFLITALDFASGVGDIYSKTKLAIKVAAKAGLTYDDVIPPWVDKILNAFDTSSYGFIFLAGVYFVSVAFKFKVKEREEIYKRYLICYTIAAVAFLVRSIPGLVFCVRSDWFNWTQPYSMDLLDSTVYAATTVTIFQSWVVLMRTPIPQHDHGNTETHDAQPPTPTDYKRPYDVYRPADSRFDTEFR